MLPYERAIDFYHKITHVFFVHEMAYGVSSFIPTATLVRRILLVVAGDTFEAAGCVFLPAAGRRSGTTVNQLETQSGSSGVATPKREEPVYRKRR